MTDEAIRQLAAIRATLDTPTEWGDKIGAGRGSDTDTGGCPEYPPQSSEADLSLADSSSVAA